MVFVIVVDAVAVGAEDDALLFDFFVRLRVAAVFNQTVDVFLVGVVGVYVMKVEYGGV